MISTHVIMRKPRSFLTGILMGCGMYHGYHHEQSWMQVGLAYLFPTPYAGYHLMKHGLKETPDSRQYRLKIDQAPSDKHNQSDSNNRQFNFTIQLQKEDFVGKATNQIEKK